MSYLRTIKMRNGDYFENFHFYKCDRCRIEIPESDPHCATDDKTEHYCWDCAFILKFISEKEFLKYCGIYLENIHAAINTHGEIEFWQSKNAVPPWERSNKQQRHSPKYNKWRNAVFERDNYTCQDCRVRGGNLNAHHLNSFKKYPKQRYIVNNGIALCEKCHRKRHGRAVNND